MRTDFKFITTTLKRMMIFAFMLTPVVAFSQNCFVDGTEWKVEGCGTESPYPNYWHCNIKQVFDAESGFSAFIVEDVEEGSIQHGVYVKTEGDQVFFKKTLSSEWLLMYDFSLSPGDVVTVYQPDYADSEGLPRPAYLKCTGVSESEEYEGLIAMELEEYSDDSYEANLDAEPERFKLGSGTWLKGVGSTQGVLWNAGFGMCGWGSRLMDVLFNGEILYSFYLSDVSCVRNDTNIQVSTNGLNLIVTTPDRNATVTVHSISGATIASSITGGRKEIPVSYPGIYLVNVNGQTQKVAVR